jgi:putative tricarboxylic transport membrane protein
MSGGGGGKAIGHLIETAARQGDTLMVNSTPIVVRSLTKVFPFSFRDLTPIAATIADYGAFVVRPDSPIKSFADMVPAFKKDPRSMKFAGGSVRGDLDHLAVALAFKAAGIDPTKVVYVPYDAGGKALAGLLSGETEALTTGLGEVINQHKQGQIRIVAITAPQRVPGLDVPTVKEAGYDAVFANWRGFFGPPGLSSARKDAYVKMFGDMYGTKTWTTVRDRNGWSDLYRPGAKFVTFLEGQEKAIGGMMKELGLLK